MHLDRLMALYRVIVLVFWGLRTDRAVMSPEHRKNVSRAPKEIEIAPKNKENKERPFHCSVSCSRVIVLSCYRVRLLGSFGCGYAV